MQLTARQHDLAANSDSNNISDQPRNSKNPPGIFNQLEINEIILK